METLFTNQLVNWVTWVEKNAIRVLMGLLLLCLASAVLVLKYGRINSDLGTLIKPSGDVAWYQQNQAYKHAFPQLQQTAVLVVSGVDSGRVDRLAINILQDLRASAVFEQVLSPALEPFLQDKKLFFLNSSEFKDWLQAARYNYGSLVRLSEDISYANGALILADQLSLGLPIPLPIESLVSEFVNGPGASESEDRLDPIDVFYGLFDPEAKQHYQLIFIKGKQALDEQLPNEKILDEIRAISNKNIGDLRGPESTLPLVRLTGEIALAHEEITAALRGVGLAGAISLIFLALILGFGIKSARLIVYIFSLLAIGLLLTAGLSVITVGSYNALSLIFVVMFFGLAVDFAVHFILRVREAASEHLERAGDKPSGAQVAAKNIGGALSLCMLTSAVAFLAFYPTDYIGLAELGVISAGGMLIALCLSFTLLPALIKLFGMPVASPSPRAPVPQIKSTKLVFLGTLVVCILAVDLGRHLEFDYSVLAMRDEQTEAMSTLLTLQREGVVTDYSIFVLAKNGLEAAALKSNVSQLSGVSKVNIPMDLMPEDQVDKSRDMKKLSDLYQELLAPEEDEFDPVELEVAIAYLDEAIEATNHTDIELAKAYSKKLKSFQQNAASLRRANLNLQTDFNADLKQLIQLLNEPAFTFQELPIELREMLIAKTGEHLVSIQPAYALKDRQATETFINQVRPHVPNIAGRSVVEWGVGSVVVESFKDALSLSLGLVMLFLVVYFRGFILPLLVLTPIAISLIVSAGICQWFGISLNMANILVVPLIIGLGVDTGIHVVSRFADQVGADQVRRAHQMGVRHGHQVRADLVSAVLTSSTSPAVLISGLTTIGTFFSLSFSPHKGAASVGIMLSIAISCLLLATFIVLPALLQVYQRWSQGLSDDMKKSNF